MKHSMRKKNEKVGKEQVVENKQVNYFGFLGNFNNPFGWRE